MAAQLPCDLCDQESAVVMFNNLVDGSAMTVGAACLPTFFGGAMLGSIGSDAHAGPPTKCQACRRVHERMTTPVAPLSVPVDDQNDHTSEPGEPATAAES